MDPLSRNVLSLSRFLIVTAMLMWIAGPGVDGRGPLEAEPKPQAASAVEVIARFTIAETWRSGCSAYGRPKEDHRRTWQIATGIADWTVRASCMWRFRDRRPVASARDVSEGPSGRGPPPSATFASRAVAWRSTREKELEMTTADAVRKRAMELARLRTNDDLAVADLLDVCQGRRVAAVRARQQLDAWLNSERDQLDAMRAIELVDEVIHRLPI